MARLLGLDVGDKRIGVALSDPTGALASPLTTLERRSKKRDATAVMELARQHEAEGIVMGMPVSLDGAHHAQARRTQSFYTALYAVSFLPATTWDERFSTYEAEQLLRESGVKPSRERGRVDAAAAAIILQRYLDAHRDPVSRSPAP